jgi:hypothetical protein
VPPSSSAPDAIPWRLCDQIWITLATPPGAGGIREMTSLAIELGVRAWSSSIAPSRESCH